MGLLGKYNTHQRPSNEGRCRGANRCEAARPADVTCTAWIVDDIHFYTRFRGPIPGDGD